MSMSNRPFNFFFGRKNYLIKIKGKAVNYFLKQDMNNKKPAKKKKQELINVEKYWTIRARERERKRSDKLNFFFREKNYLIKKKTIIKFQVIPTQSYLSVSI